MFLKRKDIEFSARRYGIDALGAMAQGLFACCARVFCRTKPRRPLRPQKEIDSRCAGSLSLAGAASGPVTGEMSRRLLCVRIGC